MSLTEAYEQAYQRKQTETQARRVLANIHEEIHGTPLNDLTLAQYSTHWLERVKPTVELSTLARYIGAIKVANEAAPATFEKRIDLVTANELDQLRATLLASRSFSTVTSDMKPLRMVFQAAWSEGLTFDNPAAKLKRLRRDRSEPGEGRRPFTLEEIRTILEKGDDEWRGMILAGYHTAGQRLGDIATMTPSNIDLPNRSVKFESSKTRRAVVLPISNEWLVDLRKRVKGKKPNEPLFPRAAAKVQAGGNVAHVSNSFRTLLSKCKLATPPGTTAGKVPGRRIASPLSFHSFRHTATSLLKNAGVSDAIARDIVGHDSAAVSANYTHMSDATKLEAMNKLPRLTS